MARDSVLRRQFDHFFDLPPEIRTQILSLLVLIPTPISISPTSRSIIPFPHAIFLSHPIIYTAASTIFYQQNTFVLDLVSGSRAAIERALSASEDDADGGHHPDILRNECARRRIRHLEFIPGRLGTAFHSHVRPAVADMLLNGALRHLKVAIYPTGPKRFLFRPGDQLPATSSPASLAGSPLALPVMDSSTQIFPANPQPDAVQRQADGQYASSEAFRALLRLLADPVLETAELWVPPVHRALFCEFHDPEAACQFAPGGMRGGWRLVQVDWRGLARQSLPEDHEMHIIRVGD